MIYNGPGWEADNEGYYSKKIGDWTIGRNRHQDWRTRFEWTAPDCRRSLDRRASYFKECLRIIEWVDQYTGDVDSNPGHMQWHHEGRSPYYSWVSNLQNNDIMVFFDESELRIVVVPLTVALAVSFRLVYVG
jgi:hypothetical protein